MKRLLCAVAALLMLLAFAVSAFSVTVDGIDGGAEWDGAPVKRLFSGESNCKVNFAAVKAKVASSESAVYLCFMFKDPDAALFNPAAGVILNVGNDTFTVTMESAPCSDDTADHSFDAAITADQNHGMTCEIRLGVKHGVPKSLDMSVRFIDTAGELSNHYAFTVENTEYSETQPVIVAPPTERPAAPPTEKPAKTTKAKKTTTQRNTSKRQTTRKATTKRPKTTIRPVKTTAERTTKAQTQRTTKEPKTKAQRTKAVRVEGNATVYYYEKEVIISQVIVTVPAAEAETTESSISALNHGTKMKVVITSLGFLLLLIISAAAAGGRLLGRRKADENDESDESDGENITY